MYVGSYSIVISFFFVDDTWSAIVPHRWDVVSTSSSRSHSNDENSCDIHNLWQPKASEIGVILFFHDIWSISTWFRIMCSGGVLYVLFYTLSDLYRCLWRHLKRNHRNHCSEASWYNAVMYVGSYSNDISFFSDI